jgi:sugar phosphate isomerase/epimerase
MSNSIKLAINFDEISDDFLEAVTVMHDLGIQYGELRTVNGKNFVFWSDKEVENFKQQLNEYGITALAAATPLFKWYSSDNDAEIAHDNFGFNPRLSEEEKRQIITGTIEVADALGIHKLRIFSELKSADDTAGDFALNHLLEYALSQAAKRNINLLIENEPVCRIHTKSTLIDFLNKNQAHNLNLWLDISNLLEIGETIDEDFLSTLGPRIKYIHVKNYIIKDRIRKYVPAGNGEIDYDSVLPLVLSHCSQEVIVSVETHAPKSEKISASRSSLVYLVDLLNKYQKGENHVRTH